MGTLLIKEKDIVTPGEELAIGMDYLPASGAFREDDKIIAQHIGIATINGRLIKIIPLRGKYTPKRDDLVIGKILDMTFSNWYVDIGCANDAVLSMRETPDFVERGADLSHYYTFGDLIVAKIMSVTRSTVDLTMRAPGLRKLGPGRLLKVDPSKVPRIIGKQGSMITLLKDRTSCHIIVGQNGLIWIHGEPTRELIITDIINLISQEAHKEGLTDKISKLLDEQLPPTTPPPPHEDRENHQPHEHPEPPFENRRHYET